MPLPVINVALLPLTERSSASTPVTASLKVIAMLVSEFTVEPGTGDVTVTVGAAKAEWSNVRMMIPMLTIRQHGSRVGRMRDFTTWGTVCVSKQ